MAVTKTRKTRTATKTTAKATKAKKEAAEETGPTPAEIRAERAAERAEKVRELTEKGMKTAEIAEEVGTTPGKVAFIQMQIEVEDNPKLKIRTTADNLGEKVVAAREKADAHSSWGWIAARTGFSEAKIKAAAEEAQPGILKTRVAQERAAKAPKKAAAKKAPKRQTARSRKAEADPS